MVSGPMKALLGVLAVAGYQNRDKIAEILRGLQSGQQAQPGSANRQGGQSEAGGLGGLLEGLSGGGGLGSLGGLLGGLSSGGALSGGLGDLLKTFQQNGHGDKAESWIGTGPNADIDGRQLKEALGPDVLDDLSQRTGLSHDDILSRLSRDLPKAVDDMTPQGQVPSPEEEFRTSASQATTGSGPATSI